MERLGRHVLTGRPDDRAEQLVDPDGCEDVRIAEWLEHTIPLPAGEVHVADDAVAEPQAQLVVAAYLDLGDEWQGGRGSHAPEVTAVGRCARAAGGP